MTIPRYNCDEYPTKSEEGKLCYFEDHESDRKANKERIAELKQAMQEFCNRMDRGEVSNTHAYSKFKYLLEAKGNEPK